jgi:four helix bundle protein
MSNVEVKNFCDSSLLFQIHIEFRTRNMDPQIFDLEDRLIQFAVRIIRLAEALPKTKVGNHIAGQIIRSGTSPAPNYGEAQSAESRSDFVHKMKVCLKELRETRVWLLMIAKANLVKSASQLDPLMDENNQLISIFVTSVKTARQKRREN